MMNFRTLCIMACLAGLTTNVWADEDDSYTNYDAIVSDLRLNADTALAPPVREELDWDEVAISGGLSLAGSFANFEVPGRGAAAGMLKGFEAHIGFNLFSKVARAEAAFSNYGQETLASNLVGDMREYEGRLVFLPYLQDNLLLRMGASLSMRSMSLHSTELNIQDTQAYYSLLLGCERKVSRNVSFGPDIAYHAPFDALSVARSSWDTSLRLNATF